MKYNLSKIMKRAWEVVRKAGTTFSKALKFSWACAKKEVQLKEEWDRSEGTVTFRIWTGYGKIRAYYSCSWMSKYANTKRDNFISLRA